MVRYNIFRQSYVFFFIFLQCGYGYETIRSFLCNGILFVFNLTDTETLVPNTEQYRRCNCDEQPSMQIMMCVFLAVSVVWGECNHSFHNCCMSLWVKQNNRCPLCQQEWIVQRIGK